ncbi:MAG: methionyl-tRNA formyltransferase [Tannerella sp.]|jgi:methionyl-tRNA formyltransferase|nr:methionyl-tRNA formyltransferase [Tannerella sp.]
MKREIRIIFMGTPEFAVVSLRTLVENDYQVVAVVTTPDKPVGRHGSVLQGSPVKEYALSMGLPVLQPERLKDEAFIEELRAFKADLQIVVAFRLLPEAVWDMPRFGTFNLHASLLPQYRGAAPINWAVIHGDKETGVTTFFLTHGIDTGKIILQHRVAIEDTDNAGTVHDRLMITGADLVLQTVDLIIEHQGNINTIPQEKLYLDASLLRPAPKLFKDTCRIDWHQPASTIHNFVRGLSPYPAAWTELEMPDGTLQQMKIYETAVYFDSKILSSPLNAKPSDSTYKSLPPGSIIADSKTFLAISTADGIIRILSVQMSGKKRLPISTFLNGFKTGLQGLKVK